MANLCFTPESGRLLKKFVSKDRATRRHFGRIVLQNRSKSSITAYGAGTKMLVIFAPVITRSSNNEKSNAQNHH
jgi:hypothetical protein